jgi:hypothetical protein
MDRQRDGAFMNLNGKRALITGASSGIGLEFAKQLHTSGAHCTLVARREDKLSQLAAELCSKRPGSAEIVVADLADEADCQKVCTLLNNGSYDLLVNNAGRGSFGRFEDLELSSELAMIRLNVEATVKLAHAAIAKMKRSGKGGAIISVSSVAAFQALPYMSTYAATKVFNFVHSMGLWAELRSCGIKVVTLCPGPTGTEFAGVARVPGSFSSIHRDDVRTVVRSCLLALDLGLPFIVPGWRSWALSLVSRLLPKVLTTWITERVMLDTLRKSR